jgi:hypothetical protein
LSENSRFERKFMPGDANMDAEHASAPGGVDERGVVVNLSRTDHAGACGLIRGKDGAKRKAPRVVLAGGPGFAVNAGEYLYLMGLDVVAAGSAEALQSLAVRNRTAAVVLPVDANPESGFLTCAKLRLARPKLKVVLVGKPCDRSRKFALFLGADYSTEADAADAVLKLI